MIPNQSLYCVPPTLSTSSYDRFLIYTLLFLLHFVVDTHAIYYIILQEWKSLFFFSPYLSRFHLNLAVSAR